MEQGKTTHSKTRSSFMNQWVSLSERRLISIRGPEARDFLQGLVTQKIDSKKSHFSALLMPSGRFHSDFFVVPCSLDGFWIDCHSDHYDGIMHIFDSIKVLHDVCIEGASKTYAVCAGIGPDIAGLVNSPAWVQGRSIFFTDPRHSNMGVRAFVPYMDLATLPHSLCVPGSEESYDLFCIQMGIPQGHRDLITDRSIILEYGYQHTNALSWDKGCYRGQELMARTYHRGHVRKHLYRLHLVSGFFPAMGTSLYMNSKRMGTMASHCKEWGLASLYTDFVDESDVLTVQDESEGLFKVRVSRCFV